MKAWGNEATVVWSVRAGFVWWMLALTAVACGTSSSRVEGETHWLSRCTADDRCDSGLACLCGVCTRPCTDDPSCSDLGSDAICEAADTTSLADACTAGAQEQVCVRADDTTSGTGGTLSTSSQSTSMATTGGAGGSSATASGGSTSTDGATESGGSGGNWAGSGGSGSGGGAGAGGNPLDCDGGLGCVLTCEGDACECQCPEPPVRCGQRLCGEGTTCCGPAACGWCIDELTGPYCPESCGYRPCGDQGQRCANAEATTAYPGQICLIHETANGPITTMTYRCERADACSDPLACSLACVGMLCSPPNTFPVHNCDSADPDTNTIVCRGGNP